MAGTLGGVGGWGAGGRSPFVVWRQFRDRRVFVLLSTAAEASLRAGG